MIYKILNKVINFINVCTQKFGDRILQYSIKTQIRRYKRYENVFFIIGIKGSLHIIRICLRFIPHTENIVLILNGMEEYEVEYARKNFNVAGFVIIPKQLKHGEIMDYLFSNMITNFGILDYDCFILDKNYFEKLKKIKENSMGNALFMYHNPVLDVDVPLTHAMSFNTYLIKKLIQEYDIKCSHKQYHKLSDKIKKKLLEIGIDENHLTEDFKDYLDTMRVLFSIGIAEGYPFNWIDRNVVNDVEKNVVFHPGGVSNPTVIHNRWRMRGSYFWQTALANNPDKSLRDYYTRMFGVLPPLDDLEKTMRNDGYTGPWFFNSVKQILS